MANAEKPVTLAQMTLFTVSIETVRSMNTPFSACSTRKAASWSGVMPVSSYRRHTWMFPAKPAVVRTS